VRLYAIYDSKAEQWGNPISFNTDGEARRSFGVLAEDLNTQVGKHPEDFLLYRVGSFDKEKGMLSGEAGTCIARAIEFHTEVTE